MLKFMIIIENNMKKDKLPFNLLGAYAKIYHDEAKRLNCDAKIIKILKNSVYGKYRI